MKRFHVNLTVSDLDKSVAFYSTLFGAEPAVQHDDYAKWMVEDPRLNFAISTKGARPGIDHIGIQAEDDAELAGIRANLEASEGQIYDQGQVTCCYADSTKAWIRDPDGVAWETFLTHGQATIYGDGVREEAARLSQSDEAACCGAPPGKEKDRKSACCQEAG